jgi:acyl-CoA reductase-like NAD-dependent aldehyde dehydrogenase
VINTRARDATLAMMQQARDAGATLRHGGDFDRNVIEPMLMTNVDPGLPIVRNELFGPGVVAMTFSSEAEAYALANDTPYGLQAGVFTSDISRATRSAAALEFGGVTINVSPTFRADQMPYGGVKESGNTKEGPAWAVRELTHERLVVLGRE